jgi:tellurite resistance protein TerC|nr:MAG TPA: integral membrane protein [Caudoviricetes sp.]
MKKAILESIFYIAISVIFGVAVYCIWGNNAGCEWFTAYIVEKMLSVDNLFVMYLIFNHFQTPKEYQHHCLFWGIVGVILLRGICIFSGVALLNMFHFLIYPLGLLLVYSGIKIYFAHNEDAEIHENKVVLYFKEHFKTHDRYIGNKFFVNGKATVLFIVLLMIETTDIVFAMDSIPVSLAISNNAFIIFSANIFAVLGLRALYFVLAEVVEKFCALKYGISIVLSFIGLKMLLCNTIHISTQFSLVVTAIVLTVSIFYSLFITTNHP